MQEEWFVAPIHVIDQAIEMIINEKIIHYNYDQELEVIVLRNE
jgi:hypothetical protein